MHACIESKQKREVLPDVEGDWWMESQHLIDDLLLVSVYPKSFTITR